MDDEYATTSKAQEHQSKSAHKQPIIAVMTACWEDTDPCPTAFKSIDDYQGQLEAKRKRRKPKVRQRQKTHDLFNNK